MPANKYEDIVMPEQHRHLAINTKILSTCRGGGISWRPPTYRLQLVSFTYGRRTNNCDGTSCNAVDSCTSSPKSGQFDHNPLRQTDLESCGLTGFDLTCGYIAAPPCRRTFNAGEANGSLASISPRSIGRSSSETLFGQ